ncbi:MAG: (5-formylfuran-3-yl)methyl phosphate synthase, partial [Candidatus Bathyarchaeales archaeon]
MKLLISPMNEAEAAEAILGGADIIDVKNPREGALGANFPWVIKRVRELAPANVKVS